MTRMRLTLRVKFSGGRWRSPLDNVEHLLEMANRKERLCFINADLGDSLAMQFIHKFVD